MNSEKTTLPSLRNIEWRTVKMETNKINQVLPYITELNELIYSVAKLVRKLVSPQKAQRDNQN